MQIKDWPKFQHYKRGNPIWIKLYRQLLNDKEWFALDPRHAKFLVSLWLLCAETNGKVPKVETVAFRLRLPEALVSQYLTACNHWVMMDSSSLLASRYTSASSETETETETETYSGAKVGEGVVKGKTPFPDGWKPDADSLEAWRKFGLDPHVEFATFRDHALANDRRCRDWSAAYRNWFRKAIKMKEEHRHELRPVR